MEPVKLKQRPEDFVVEELDDLRLGEGRYAVYRLSKKGIGTIEAIGRIAREFGVARDAVGFGGLKDKWAATGQRISIENGPERDLKTDRFELAFEGRSAEPVGRARFERNRFSITIRDLWEGDLRHLRTALEEIRADGLPNYFDSQRFGSAKGADEFIAKRLILGDFEGALKLAVATPNPDDRADARRIKKKFQEKWGRWGEMDRPGDRLVRVLAKDPQAWGRAFETLDRRLRLLYASAYQSFLWNQVLERLIRRHIMPSQRFRKAYARGQLLFYRRLAAKQRERFLAMKIPFLRRGAALDDPEVGEIASEVVKEQGFRMEDLKIRGLATTYFGRGSRAAIVVPQNLSMAEPEPDELNARKLKATLVFELAKGSYATILVKRIFH